MLSLPPCPTLNFPSLGSALNTALLLGAGPLPSSKMQRAPEQEPAHLGDSTLGLSFPICAKEQRGNVGKASVSKVPYLGNWSNTKAVTVWLHLLECGEYL